eukprot:PhM_4_TR9495/c1_g1_i2/m.25924
MYGQDQYQQQYPPQAYPQQQEAQDNDCAPLQTQLMSTNVGVGSRDVFDHDKYSFDLLQENRDFQMPRSDTSFKVAAVAQMYFLFNAVITVMSLAFNFRRSHNTTSWMGDVAVYAPLGFFALYYLHFNNYYSEQVYYLYLKHGAIIDFPGTEQYAEWVKRALPLTFLASFFAYMGFMVFYLLKFNCSFNEIYVFLSNLVIGVAMFWYRNQSIEWKFVSLSDFVQSFPDKIGNRRNIDAKSLSSASSTLKDMVLLETRNSCYSGNMRKWYWENKGVEGSRQTMYRLLMVGVMFVAAGIAVAFFQRSISALEREEWDKMIKPCVVVCKAMSMNVCGSCLATCRAATQLESNKYCSDVCCP